MSHYKHLTITEREMIMFFLAKGLNLSQIAKKFIEIHQLFPVRFGATLLNNNIFLLRQSRNTVIAVRPAAHIENLKTRIFSNGSKSCFWSIIGHLKK